ncbi:hypothetical protein [Paenisporosarcina sp. NPDC076898]|uniref:hypothetical protein n=1 Tax=unclassified Paenisporosarcina TaxID=2642018 RepID=UPI003D009FE7
MSNDYSEGDKMIFASYIMLEVAAMQAENEICKANGHYPKFNGNDFAKAVKWANERMRGGWF